MAHIPEGYVQFVGSAYPRVYTSINGGANPTFDEYDEDPQPHTGPFVLKSAYDALYELVKTYQKPKEGVEAAVENGAPFTHLGKSIDAFSQLISPAAQAEAEEHGEEFFPAQGIPDTVVIQRDDPGKWGKVNLAMNLGQKVILATRLTPVPQDDVRFLTGNEPKPNDPFSAYENQCGDVCLEDGGM